MGPKPQVNCEDHLDRIRRMSLEVDMPQKDGGGALAGAVKCGLAILMSLMVTLWVSPVLASLSENCTDCHGTFAEVHGNVNHNAEPANGVVAVFADYDHDSAGWWKPSPQFGVHVDCSTCHTRDLLAAHGNHCATCHPNPYRSLGTWNGGCQQGGCHSVYHEDIIPAHKPFADPTAWDNCHLCHQGGMAGATQFDCLNCHASYGPGNITSPTTSTNAIESYVGPAKIVFSITDGGKVGIGTTFYRLNGGETSAGSHAFVSAPGQHELEYWSMDQDGNVEQLRKKTYFSVIEDTIPPTTTSDARENYLQGGLITLTSTDNSTLGVKKTYYRLDNGPTQTGTKVQLPLKNGVVEYTLTFWSEDWSGNIEEPRSVNFTVSSGSGTLRLVYRNSDLTGSPCPGDPEAQALYTIRKDSWGGPLVARKWVGCPDWSGVDDIHLPVGSTQYFAIIESWDSQNGDDEVSFWGIYITTPGEVIRLSY